MKTFKRVVETETVAPITLIQTTTATLTTTKRRTTKTVTEPKESLNLFNHPVRHVTKQTTPQKKTNMDLTQPLERLPGKEDRKSRIRSHNVTIKVFQMRLLKLQPKY